MKIYAMKVNHVERPIGYGFNPVVLSWKVEGVGKLKKNARVQIALDKSFTNIVHDSGESNQIDSIGYKVDMELKPRTRYYWKVLVISNQEEVVEGEDYFETGKMNEKWSGEWIKAPFYASPYLRKEFIVDECQDATLYVIGRGLFEIYINGVRVGEDVLDPGYSCYNLWEQIHTYKVSSYLKKGKNVIGFILGDGWYRGRLGYDGDYVNNYGSELMIIGELYILKENNDYEMIKTDGSFLCNDSPIVESNIYDGEVYDARMEISHWSEEPLSGIKWIPVITCGNQTIDAHDRLRIPLKKHEVFEPTIIESPKGEIILDFGQNMAGWIEGPVEIAEGKSVLLQYGEILQEDCFYRENLRNAQARYLYYSNGNRGWIKPHFTYYGFRYVNVVGDVAHEDLLKFRAYAIYSDMEELMKVKTSDPLVNQLLSNVMWVQKSNYFDIPTDCPQRNERLGWTGDAQLFASTGSYQMDTCAFYTKYLKDMRLEQIELDGGIPFVIPNLKRVSAKSRLRDHSGCAWGDAATVLPWTMYTHYGDMELLKKCYPLMKDWVDYVTKISESTGIKRLWDSGFHFADWLALDNYKNPDSTQGGTDNYYVATAWYAYSTKLVTKAANVLGYADDIKYYKNLLEEIKVAMCKEYFTESGRCAIPTQTAKVLALSFDLVPKENRERVAKDLVIQLRENNMKLETGLTGTPFLLPILSEMGYNEEAYTLFLNKEIPGWLYEVIMGATTVWERWDSVMPDYTMNPGGMNSLNHYALGSVLDWFYHTVCGIGVNEDNPGFKIINLEPKIDARIEWIQCEFNSIGGIYKIEWKIVNNHVEYLFEIPFGREAHLKLPNEEMIVLSSGLHTYTRNI